MSDGSISQDEIDALLSGVGMSGGTPVPSNQADGGFSDFKKNALAQFAKGNVPSLSSNLESMTGMGVTLSEPAIQLTEREAFLKNVSEMVVSSQVGFSGSLSGEHVFVMSPEFGKKLVSLVNHEDSVEIDDMALSVLSETMSQYVGSEITALEGAGLSGVSSDPAESVHVPKAMLQVPAHNFVSLAYDIQLDGESYKLWELIPEETADSIVNTLAGPEQVAPAGGGFSADSSDGVQNMMNGMQANQQASMQGMQNLMGGMQQGMQAGMMGGAPQGGMQGMGGMMGMNPNIQSVQFPQLQGAPIQGEQGNIGLIMDVYMEMTVELGRTKKMIKEILGMGEGHIIELDKLAGEPVDILVNHKPIAKGEVVVIEENFGVRITEILSPAERLTDV